MKKVLITLSYNSETRCWFRCFHLNVNSHNTKQRLSRTDAVITERATGRKPRGPQVAGEYKLQVADSAPLHSVLLKTNLFVFVFFLFSSLGLIMAQQTFIHVDCYGQGWHTLFILSQKCILWERGLLKLPQLWGAPFIWLEAHEQT